MFTIPPAVTAFAGARDAYQLPLALFEANLLNALVTEFYWPLDKRWFADTIGHILPKQVLQARYSSELGSRYVRTVKQAFILSMLNRRFPRNEVARLKDRLLSKTAWSLADKSQSALFMYSYYAYEAFQRGAKYRFLFQVHPHPESVRRIFIEEMERIPSTRSSLMAEQEIKLSENLFQELVREPQLANGWVTASTFTARTLTEHGIPLDRIHVVPYGVDTSRFFQRAAPPSRNQPFTVIFVGSMRQRKGLSYLLEAIQMLKSREIQLVLCGRGGIDEDLINHFGRGLNLDVKPGLPYSQLVKQVHSSDVFVLPSLVEGFGHVILENMACGLPIIATPHTAAPDLIEEGHQGFIVPIRSAEAIAEKLEWGISNRNQLAQMGHAAADRSHEFTWARFREKIRRAYYAMVEQTDKGELEC